MLDVKSSTQPKRSNRCLIRNQVLSLNGLIGARYGIWDDDDHVLQGSGVIRNNCEGLFIYLQPYSKNTSFQKILKPFDLIKTEYPLT